MKFNRPITTPVTASVPASETTFVVSHHYVENPTAPSGETASPRAPRSRIIAHWVKDEQGLHCEWIVD